MFIVKELSVAMACFRNCDTVILRFLDSNTTKNEVPPFGQIVVTFRADCRNLSGRLP